MLTGTVEWFVSSRGTGVILGDDGEIYFFNRWDVDDSCPDLNHNDRVQFGVSHIPEGFKATNIHKLTVCV